METAIYVVQPQDTLERIAAKFTVPVSEILYLNGFSGPEQLVTGQAILIPHILKVVKSLGYFQVGDPDNLERTLAEIGGFFTYGGVFQFPVTTGGAVIIPGNVDVNRVINLLKQYHVLPLMVITNLGPERFDPDLERAVISDEALKAQLIRNLLSLMAPYGFAGVNIDFENVYPADRELFTGFIRDLKLAFSTEGYLVSLTVPPKNKDLPEDLQGAYDYQALGEWADFVLIMTYDWGYMAGPPMAVAPINEVQKVIAYAVTQIPSVKILQGIPLYGYNWRLPFTPGTLATVVNLVEVYDLARRYRAEINYDPAAQSPNFRYTDEDGVQHEVWFEDARSVTAKYGLVRDYSLGGPGFWSSWNYPYGFQQNWMLFREMFQLSRVILDLQKKDDWPRNT